MRRLLLATNNPGKLVEMRALLDDLGLELLAPTQVSLEMDVEEDGQTYAENAARKAQAFARTSGLLTLADDSGLEVDALNGAPGLHSARYSPKPGATDADRRAYLLKNLRGLPQPWTARFRCVIAISTPQGECTFTEGSCPGVVIPDERGHNGCVYDPIFFLPELGQTMAQLEETEKNKLSHRGRAILAARPLLLALAADGE